MNKKTILKGLIALIVGLPCASLSAQNDGVADLIVTALSWEPLHPKEGEGILFTATIKNIGQAASIADPAPGKSHELKHGVAFQVNGVGGLWNDKHWVSMLPGEEITLTASGGNHDLPFVEINDDDAVAYWVCGNQYRYLVTAWVNDTKNILESDDSDRSNMLTLEMTTGNPSGIPSVPVSSSATVAVYNVNGQLVAEDVNAKLAPGVYIVKVQDEGRLSVHKVVVK